MKEFTRKQKQFPCGTYPAQFTGLVKTPSGYYRLKFLVYCDKLQEYESIASNEKFVYPKKPLGKTPEESLHDGFKVKIGLTALGQNTIVSFKRDSTFVVPVWARQKQDEWQSKDGAKAAYIKNRMEKDEKFARTQKLRELQNKAIAGKIPDELCVKVFGCTHAALRSHIEKQFQKGMTWINRGMKWHLDHIRPLSRFNVFDDKEAKEALHYTNLQVLTPDANVEKYNEEPAWDGERKGKLEYVFGEDSKS